MKVQLVVRTATRSPVFAQHAQMKFRPRALRLVSMSRVQRSTISDRRKTVFGRRAHPHSPSGRLGWRRLSGPSHRLWSTSRKPVASSINESVSLGFGMKVAAFDQNPNPSFKRTGLRPAA